MEAEGIDQVEITAGHCESGFTFERTALYGASGSPSIAM